MVANMRQCRYYVQVKHSLWTVRSVTVMQMSISQFWQCQLRKTVVSVETEHLHSSTDLISNQVAYICFSARYNVLHAGSTSKTLSIICQNISSQESSSLSIRVPLHEVMNAYWSKIIIYEPNNALF